MVTNEDVALNKILRICSKYTNNESYVYKLCRDVSLQSIEISNEDKRAVWLVIMQKLDDTKTNEDRKSVVNKNYAKFRANRLKVINIIHAHDPSIILSKNYIVNEYEDILTMYEIGNIVVANDYDEDINKVCSEGDSEITSKS
jgi:hypothetical protein